MLDNRHGFFIFNTGQIFFFDFFYYLYKNRLSTFYNFWDPFNSDARGELFIIAPYASVKFGPDYNAILSDKALSRM